MRDDRLIEIKVFKAAVDLGSFTAAAHHLSVSQPYISKIINNLEERLGITLIHRSTRQQKITLEGRDFLRYCQRILADFEEVERWAYSSSSKRSPVGELRITAPIAFGIDQVSKIIPKFIESYPEIQINLSLTDKIESLLDGNLDVAIRMGTLPDSSLKSRRLCSLNRLIVAAPSYIKKHGTPNSPEELVSHNCLLWSGGREHLNKWPFNINGKLREVVVSGNIKSSNGLALMNMCYQGVGIMRMAEHVALPAIKSGKILEVLGNYHVKDDSNVYAVFLSEKELAPRIRVFVDFIYEELKVNPWEDELSSHHVS